MRDGEEELPKQVKESKVDKSEDKLRVPRCTTQTPNSGTMCGCEKAAMLIAS